MFVGAQVAAHDDSNAVNATEKGGQVGREADGLKLGSVNDKAIGDGRTFGRERSHVHAGGSAPGDGGIGGVRRLEKVSLAIAETRESFCVTGGQANSADNDPRGIDAFRYCRAVGCRYLEGVKRAGCGTLRLSNQRAER